MVGTEGERHQDGGAGAVSVMDTRGCCLAIGTWSYGGRGLSVLEVGQVSLRELRPQARRDQEALLRAYAGGDQSHLPILNRWRTEK